MTGILLLFVGALWLIVAYSLAMLITRVLPATGWRVLVGALLFLALLPLPLIDEIVGKRQFEQLCRENSTVHVDRAKAAGRTVYLADLPHIEIRGTWVRVVSQPWRYLDAKTGEVIVSYNMLQAEGGRFIRTLGISEGGVPLTFDGHCKPEGLANPAKLLKELGAIQIQRSELGKRDGR
jgi:hypothetical protein